MVHTSNFKDSAFFKKLERQAYDGTIDFTRFPPAEYKYFSELAKIYYAFKFEGISKEDASRKKAILFQSYQDSIRERNQCSEVYKYYQDNIRIAEMNLSRINKSHDITEIALLSCETLGCLTGDSCFYRLQKRKIMEEKV